MSFSDNLAVLNERIVKIDPIVLKLIQYQLKNY